MTIDASLNLRIVQNPALHSWIVVPPSETVKLLVDYGWNLINKDGNVVYLPLHDDDAYNWTISPIDGKSIMKIIEEKEQLNEIVGIMLRWEDTEIVGKVLLWPEKKMKEKKLHTSMTFYLEPDRKMIDDPNYNNITDVNWYLLAILPALHEGDTFVESFTYDEHI